MTPATAGKNNFGDGTVPKHKSLGRGGGTGEGKPFFRKALLPRSVQGNYFVGSMTS
ncbi:hypothetical protein Bwad005_15610 [Bilophila wadsworthia]